MAEELLLLQIVCGELLSTIGVGLTVISMVLVNPMHEFAEGVTVMVPVMVELVVFVALKAPIFPFPEAPKPMFTFVFVHEYVVPETEPEKLMAADELLLQMV